MTTATMTKPEVTREDIERYKSDKKEMPQRLAILSWDESDILDAEVEARKEYDDDKRTDDEWRKEIYEDSDFWFMMREDLHDNLSGLMQERNPSGEWVACVENFGWMMRNGTLPAFHCEEGKKLLQMVLPECDCTYYIHNYECDGKKGFAIQNYHHDSPTGKEWYFILPA